MMKQDSWTGSLSSATLFLGIIGERPPCFRSKRKTKGKHFLVVTFPIYWQSSTGIYPKASYTRDSLQHKWAGDIGGKMEALVVKGIQMGSSRVYQVNLVTLGCIIKVKWWWRMKMANHGTIEGTNCYKTKGHLGPWYLMKMVNHETIDRGLIVARPRVILVHGI